VDYTYPAKDEIHEGTAKCWYVTGWYSGEILCISIPVPSTGSFPACDDGRSRISGGICSLRPGSYGAGSGFI